MMVLLLLTACSARQQIAPSLDVVTFPDDANATYVEELGDTLVLKVHQYTYAAVEISTVVKAQGVLFAMEMDPQPLRAMTEDGHWTYYHAQSFRVWDASWRQAEGGLKVSKANPKRIEMFTDYPVIGPLPQPNPIPIVQFGRVQDTTRPALKQELIYSGRSGNMVKFLYREFVGDLIRSAYTQELQYDLSEGNVIGIKGTRIELIEVKNTELKYKVLNNFSDNPQWRQESITPLMPTPSDKQRAMINEQTYPG
jgi:hypothetical protein